MLSYNIYYFYLLNTAIYSRSYYYNVISYTALIDLSDYYSLY